MMPLNPLSFYEDFFFEKSCPICLNLKPKPIHEPILCMKRYLILKTLKDKGDLTTDVIISHVGLQVAKICTELEAGCKKELGL